MVASPTSVVSGIDYIAIALSLLPPLIPTAPAPCEPIVPRLHFCAARLPLPQLIPSTATLGIEIAPSTSISRPRSTSNALNDSLETILSIQVGEYLGWHCTNIILPASNDTSNGFHSATKAKLRGISPQHLGVENEGQINEGFRRILAVQRVFSSLNGKLVLLGRISYPEYTNCDGGVVATLAKGPQIINAYWGQQKWREEETLVIAKLRLSNDEAESWHAHANELKMLSAVSGSKWHDMFPKLVGTGQVKIPTTMSAILGLVSMHTRPLLLMSYIPHPSITDILRNPLNSTLPNHLYNTGDKTVFHNDSVLRQGLDCAVTALQVLGLRHDDLKGGNVVYRVATGSFVIGRGAGCAKGSRGKVWLVDMESVAALILGDGKRRIIPHETKQDGNKREVEEILSDFWKYELCCADGKCRVDDDAITLETVVE